MNEKSRGVVWNAMVKGEKVEQAEQ